MMAATLFGYLIRLALIFSRRMDSERRLLDFTSGARIDHHRDAPWSPLLGDEVRRTLAFTTGSENRCPASESRPHNLTYPLSR